MGQKDRFTYEIKLTGRGEHEWTILRNLQEPLDALNDAIEFFSWTGDREKECAGLVAARDIFVCLCTVAAGGAVASFRIRPTHPLVENKTGRQICCHVCHACGSSLITIADGVTSCAACSA